MFYLMMHSTHFLESNTNHRYPTGFTLNMAKTRKEMFYFTMHSTHVLASNTDRRYPTGFMLIMAETRMEGNVSFNDALNTFLFMAIWKEGRKCFI